MAKTSELEAAYHATAYRVFIPSGLVELRIGQPCAHLADWLASKDFSDFAIITAFNPASRRLSNEENAERQASLECDLVEGNYEPYLAENVPDDAVWPVEEACFVPDIAQEDAVALAIDYGQNAVVYGKADGLPYLLWTEDWEK